MAEEIDAGIDKQKILAEIGAGAPLPGAAGTAFPPPQARAAPAADLPQAASPPPRPSSPGRLARHRRQIAAMVMVSVSLLWFGVGLATRGWAPFAVGGAFLGLAILVGVGTLLREFP